MGNGAQKGPPKQSVLGRIMWTHPTVMASIIGVGGVVLGAMISLFGAPDVQKLMKEDRAYYGKLLRTHLSDSIRNYYYNEMDSLRTDQTYVFSDLRNFSIWNDSKDHYIWFNAQYRLASSIHINNHINLVKRMKFTFYLVQPTNGSKEDSINFRQKFHDFRIFYRRASIKAAEDHVEIKDNMKEVYLVTESRRPSISFFMTRDRHTGNEKVIIYIEDPKLIDEQRVPQVCVISEDPFLLELLNSRLNDLEKKRSLNYDSLINEKIPDEAFLK